MEGPMKSQSATSCSRRYFVRGLSFAGVAGVLGLRPRTVAAEPPPETTKLRLVQTSSICWAPQYLAGELLRAEGFVDVQYVKMASGVISEVLAAGEADISMNFVGPHIIRVDMGDPIVFLAGAHVGCFELFANEPIRAIRDLKGKIVAVAWLGGPEHIFLSSMVAYVGLDPRTDISWARFPPSESMRLFEDGLVDAFLAFPPSPQELRARKIGRVVVNSAIDRPWSQYFCCVVTGNREFVRKYPVATKRALRAILKAADLCALEPDRAARVLVDKGYIRQYEYALQAMKDVPYGKWRVYDPEDTIRFYALRLHEAGMIKSSPQKIIAQSTNWRFLKELKKELKG
ncbi:MAG TPA: ABC transporter substrate-binding protein [Methylomirabilota bacterium]|jgi:NitT/TauT family transport system substrate-binding protein|nr:ABC transporter substrate-binding protein [Methylomirabilota bacterium]